jgi:hypothetical protein
MKQAPENEPEMETEAIRSEIDTTRRRMDDTMDALGDRLKGRHLLDEILGFFRSEGNQVEGKAAEIRHKITDSASSAARSVADTVKTNPMPFLLIGAGVAWMIYSSRKQSSSGRYEDEVYGSAAGYDPDASYDRPLEYPTSSEDEPGFGEADSGFAIRGSSESDFGESDQPSKLEQVKVGFQEKASEVKDQAKQKLANVGNQVRQKTQAAGQRAREIGSRVQARTREVYASTRQTVVKTADEHPLELGIACLAAGVAAGLALPTPDRLNRLVGPPMDRLRQRTRDASKEYVKKGKRVVNAATTAVKNEAQAQGLTLEQLRGKASAVADRAKDAAGEAAQREGINPGASGGQGGNENQNQGQTQSGSQAQPAPTANAGRGI